jgi:hypothetical protein
MIKIRFVFVMVMLVIFITGCSFNASNLNEEFVKDEAEKVTGLFYENLEQNDYDAVGELFSEKFYKITPRDSFGVFLKKLKNDLGNYKSKTLTQWSSRRVTGTNPVTECVLVYSVKHDKFDAVEKITVIEENNRMKIFGYHVNSPAFDPPVKK